MAQRTPHPVRVSNAEDSASSRGAKAIVRRVDADVAFAIVLKAYRIVATLSRETCTVLC